MKKQWIALLGLLLFPALLAAQTTAKSKPFTLILAGKLLDVRTGKLLINQKILIAGDRIEAVGQIETKRALNAEVIDLSDKVVLPGLIDAHTHLTMDPQDMGYSSLGLSIPRQALTGAKNARLTLMAGFTTVRNVAAAGYSDIALRDSINAGEIPGPRIDASGPALSITGGHCDNNLLAPQFHAQEDGVADGVEAVQKKVRENIKFGADVIKVCATGGVLSKGDDPNASAFTMAELEAIVNDAHRLGRKVAAHAHGAEGIKFAVEAGVDSIEHGSFINEEDIQLMKQHGTYLVPTLYLGDWFLENAEAIHVPPFMIEKAKVVMPAARANLAKAFKEGVKVAFGTDAAVYPHGLNGREFAVMVQVGLSPLAALQAATINAADLLGWSQNIGAIEPGKWADIIAVNQNPLDDVHTLENVPFVMKSGVVYKNEK
ncbi:MAG: amidohydrolase family protein [Acidobacteriia bacterium]|nr:amidohydrolase family protein [Terriglobia bacterium]